MRAWVRGRLSGAIVIENIAIKNLAMLVASCVIQAPGQRNVTLSYGVLRNGKMLKTGD